jgi:hypothetical protein
MPSNGTSNSKLTGVEHLFIDRLPARARRLIDFRTHVRRAVTRFIYLNS